MHSFQLQLYSHFVFISYERLVLVQCLRRVWPSRVGDERRSDGTRVAEPFPQQWSVFCWHKKNECKSQFCHSFYRFVCYSTFGYTMRSILHSDDSSSYSSSYSLSLRYYLWVSYFQWFIVCISLEHNLKDIEKKMF